MYWLWWCIGYVLVVIIYCIGILIGIVLKELMVCDVDYYYLCFVILCKIGGGDMCI